MTGHKLVSSHLRLCNSPANSSTAKLPLPGTSAQAGAHESAGPPALVPGRVPPLLLSQVSLLPTNQPQLRPGTVGIKMKAARFVMRSAGTLIPREVEHFSRYSPSPLSMKQLLDFGERGSGAREGLGSCLSFQSRCREDSVT